jgi:hypothetical protein
VFSENRRTSWPETSHGTACVAILRNPGGTYEGQNQYVLVAWNNRIDFSVMK